MRSLSAAELLNVWEQGLAQLPVQRALTLLVAACPEIPSEDLARLSIGQRDALLLTLREWLFGSQVQSVATCPVCGDRLELCFQVADIRVDTSNPVETCSLQVADYEVQFRLPNSLDLLAMTTSSSLCDTETASPAKMLLHRCLLNISSEGKEQSWEQLPPSAINEVVQQMAQIDAQADVQLHLDCPNCQHQWQTVFDIVSFFWTEIHAWAERTLSEVHALATAYGWGEQDILAMSPYRRRLYLEMLL